MVVNSVRVMAFNIWDIPVSQHRKKRMERIAEILRENKDDLDLVGLIECWIEEDRTMLIKAAKMGGLEHHIFFRNGCGFPGGNSSGLVILSKWPIENCFYHRFTAAGKAQKILHWDYSLYSGKGIGVAHIRGPEEVGNIDFFISHFVAYYTPHPEDPKYDEYVYHRRLGAWEAAQFIKSTAREDSFIACCVDLNADPTTLTYRALTGLSGLDDAWEKAGRARKGALPDALDSVEQNGLSVNFPGNCFHNNNMWIASGEPSARVDYVLFSKHPKIVPDWCERRFAGPEDSGSIVSLSDHAAVLASFRVELEVQPRALDTKEETRTGVETGHHFQCLASAKLLEELEKSASGGHESSLKRRRIAIWKATIFALISFLSIILPDLMMSDHSFAFTIGQYLVCVGFALSAYSYFILGNITIPDEESAMLFMQSSIRFNKGQLLGDETAMNIS